MSKELIIKNQKQLDEIKPDFDGIVYIEGGERYDPLVLNVAFEYARVIVRGESFVKLRGSSHAVLRESSHAELWGSSHAELRESSHAELWGSSHAELRESSHAVLRESSHAVLRESSHAELRESSHAVLRGSSHAVLWGSSHAELRESSHAVLYGEAMISAKSAEEIVCHGYNVISVTKSDQKNMTIVMNKDSYLKVVPDFKPSFEEFARRYPVEVKDGKAILYKAVHLRDGKYRSDYSGSFEYKVGETHKEKVDSVDESCAAGLHVSNRSWAISYGLAWEDMALLECEVPIKSIKVSSDCDGKVRTSTLKVIREVPRSEWYV